MKFDAEMKNLIVLIGLGGSYGLGVECERSLNKFVGALEQNEMMIDFIDAEDLPNVKNKYIADIAKDEAFYLEILRRECSPDDFAVASERLSQVANSMKGLFIRDANVPINPHV